jgi:bifunctional non-homologous end joining protein LigD
MNWLYEVKLDGYRCLAGRDAFGVTLWSRRENVFTGQFPQIARACEQLPPGTLLDGEIVALGTDGRISFSLLQNHRSAAQALLFYVFDALMYRGRSLLNAPLEERRGILSQMFGAGTISAPLGLSEAIDASPAELIAVVKEFGLEGIVAKRRDSVYESGKRSGAWLKYKINQCQEFVVGGYTQGDPFDALVVGRYEADGLVYVSKVRAGFVPRVRRDVASRFTGLETGVCPFANLPERRRTPWALTREQMEHCVWLQPHLVVQVEYSEFTPDGHLRQAKFRGLRDDKDAREVTPP